MCNEEISHHAWEEQAPKRGRTSDTVYIPARTTETTAPSRVAVVNTDGMLAGLLTMPTDIFLEVASHLFPRDLLYLSRMSRTLRQVLLSKRNRGVWRLSIASTDGFPPCPTDMSEPVYIALLFDKYCFLCGSRYGNWVDYAIRLRLCKRCSEENIKEGTQILGQYSRYECGLNFVPCVGGNTVARANLLKDKNQKHDLNDFYYVRDVDAMVSEYDKLLEEDKATGRITAEIKTRYSQALAILLYMEPFVAEERRVTEERRISAIVSRLVEMGYKEDDFPKDSTNWNKILRQPYDLTDLSWNKHRPKLIALLAGERERREAEVLKQRVAKRVDQIIPLYERFIAEDVRKDERGLMPNEADARCLPSIVDLAEENGARGTVSYQHFRAISQDLRIQTEAYEHHVKQALIRLVMDEDEDFEEQLAGLDPDIALLRYPACFWCAPHCPLYDNCVYMTYPELHAHWRAAHAREKFLFRRRDRGPLVPVACVPPVSYPVDIRGLAREMMEAVGIPPDTGRDVLDAYVKEGKLYCGCGDPVMPPVARLDWMKLVVHVFDHKIVYNERMMLRNRKAKRPQREGKPAWRDDHPLAVDNCILKLDHKGADHRHKDADYRLRIAPELRAKIEDWIAKPTEKAVALCKRCTTLTRADVKTKRFVDDLHLVRLPETANEIVWHMWSCHSCVDPKEEDVMWLYGKATKR